LVALLSKPNGVRVSVISDRLGWQAHTVRAAISGLRKRGHEIVTLKSQKTGEMVYTISANTKENEADTVEASS
jgi:predicted DNA-binding transcriptional regulator